MTYDVIIAGAGPAGTAAGFDLVSAGYAVLLLDRQRFPGKSLCRRVDVKGGGSVCVRYLRAYRAVLP